MKHHLSSLQQKLLRRQSCRTPASHSSLLPSGQPHISRSNSEQGVPSESQSQYVSTLQPPQQKSMAQTSTQPNSKASVSTPILPSVALPPQSPTNPHPIATKRGLMSPAQKKLLQERFQHKTATGKGNFEGPICRNVSGQADGPTCVSHREGMSSSGLLSFDKRNASVRRAALSPAMTTFTAPQTTSYFTALRRRKALLVGIGYQGHRFLRPLPGCRNDVRNMFNLLTGPLFGFSKDNIRILCDELESLDGVESLLPTRINITRFLHWLTVDIVHGDSVVFFFAGHGDFVEDLSGDEVESGYDQCIMPMDYEVPPKHGAGKTPKGAPAILDDMIYERLVRGVPEGARVTAIVDACRSGTMCDLPVQYGEDGGVHYRNGEKKPPRQRRKPYSSAGGCVLFSGSGDNQMSADMVVPSHLGEGHPPEHCGIMTRSFIDAISEMCAERGPDYNGVECRTYGELLDRIRVLVRERARSVLPDYMEEQEPQLSTSHAIDIWSTPFTI